ncbi:hypothetical protein AB0I28_09710 [Phytomonospora sp. NPDC050363]|uniref:hypothetical protein n=1 Tax=Phytomonospora sp. NPDC050363 TaxID=3155642 RepID=UPI0033D23647
MYVIDRTITVVICCDTCGQDWEGTRTEPLTLSPDDAAGEPWRDQLTGDGWTLIDGWELTEAITCTRVLCRECAAGRTPDICCRHCGTVLTRSDSSEEGSA